MRFNDLTGNRYGKLVVISRVKTKPQNGKHAKWLCECDCGNKTEVQSNALKSGATKSCGCYHSQRVIETHTKHNLSNTRIKKIHTAMLQRCYNHKSNRYDRYGGRGIKVCDEWLGNDGLLNFYNWAISNGYAEGLSIDRIDNNGNYEPSNCRWATMEQQSNNRECNRYITYNGETHTIAEWGRIKGIKKVTLTGRFARKYTVEEALTRPLRSKKNIQRVVD